MTNKSKGKGIQDIIMKECGRKPQACTTPPNAIAVPNVASRMATARSRVAKARENLARVSAAQKKHYDARHSPVALKADDRVFVLLEDHPIRSLVQDMNKLKHKKWGPFEIIEMVGKQAARLRLPPSSRVHPVISTLHLQKFVEVKFGHTSKPPPAGVIDGEDACEVEYIFGEPTRRSGHTEFKVKWAGYPNTEFTWEPESNLRHDLGSTASELLYAYRKKRDTAARFATSLQAYSGPHKDRPIYFISRVLKSYEESYTILELEMAAVAWAILKFQHYLYGSVFTVVTDHQSLLCVTSSSSTTLYSARVDKWQMLLAPYLGQMTLVHRAGRVHGNADGLSRSRRDPSAS